MNLAKLVKITHKGVAATLNKLSDQLDAKGNKQTDPEQSETFGNDAAKWNHVAELVKKSDITGAKSIIKSMDKECRKALYDMVGVNKTALETAIDLVM